MQDVNFYQAFMTQNEAYARYSLGIQSPTHQPTLAPILPSPAPSPAPTDDPWSNSNEYLEMADSMIIQEVVGQTIESCKNTAVALNTAGFAYYFYPYDDDICEIYARGDDLVSSVRWVYFVGKQLWPSCTNVITETYHSTIELCKEDCFQDTTCESFDYVQTSCKKYDRSIKDTSCILALYGNNFNPEGPTGIWDEVTGYCPGEIVGGCPPFHLTYVLDHEWTNYGDTQTPVPNFPSFNDPTVYFGVIDENTLQPASGVTHSERTNPVYYQNLMTYAPTDSPTMSPTMVPSPSPTMSPTLAPSLSPTFDSIPCASEWQCQTFGLGRCVYDYPVHTKWRNAGIGADVLEKTFGDEGGCACYQNSTIGYWELTLFCEDCVYGYGPRKATIGLEFEPSSCDLSLTNPPLESITHCTAPYGLDPILATTENAYKLCAGHGNYTGTQCICFDNNDQGHWTLDVEDGAGMTPNVPPSNTCRACKAAAYGPKPKNVADVRSREINNNAAFDKNETCANKPIQACNTLGNYDANDYVFEDDKKWVVCSGHGNWDENLYECQCHTGWNLAGNSAIPYGPSSFKSCNLCSPDFGPLVDFEATQPDFCYTDDESFVPTKEQSQQCAGFCIGPFLPDPNVPDSDPLLCSGHGFVNETLGCDCDESQEKGYWKAVEGEDVASCTQCKEGWGPLAGVSNACFKQYGLNPLNTSSYEECAGHGVYENGECTCEEGWKVNPETGVCEWCDDEKHYGPDKVCNETLYDYDPWIVNPIYPDNYHLCSNHSIGLTSERECICENWFKDDTLCHTCDFSYPGELNTTTCQQL